MKSNNDPLISIITVCRNSEKTIRRTIESVLNQSYQNFEYIIIDGKSTDKTLEIISEFIQLFPGKIQLVSERDQGIYDAMNKGILIASGELIGLINSDDWYEKNTLETIASHYRDNGSKVVFYGLMRIFRKELLQCIQSHSHNFLNEGMINHPTCFVPKSVYETYGLFSLKYKYSSDYEFMLRLWKNKVEFVHIEIILSNMEQGGVSFDNLKALKETFAILRYYNILPYKEFLVRMFEVYVKLLYKSLFGKKLSRV
jgi:glycosyltransferase involved in cell wall biosynthesis